MSAQYCLCKVGVIANVVMGLVSSSGSAKEIIYKHTYICICIHINIICNVYFNKVYTLMLRVFNGKISVQCCNYLFVMISFFLWDFSIL